VKIVSIGELLWDVIDGGEHIGGAPFNFSAGSIKGDVKRKDHSVNAKEEG